MWAKRALVLCAFGHPDGVRRILFALLLRFDFRYSAIPLEYLDGYFRTAPVWCALTLVVFYVFRLYHSIWSFAGAAELWRIVGAYCVLIPVYFLCAFLMRMDMPKAYYVFGFVTNLGLTTVLRFLSGFSTSSRGRAHSMGK